MTALQQEAAHGQQTQASAEGLDRADGRDAERVQAEQNGRGEDQNPSETHGARVPERTIPQTATELVDELIDRLIVVAHGCAPEVAAQRLKALIHEAPAALSDAQNALMVQLASEWTGTPSQFARRYGYTRQRLHQMGVRWRSR